MPAELHIIEMSMVVLGKGLHYECVSISKCTCRRLLKDFSSTVVRHFNDDSHAINKSDISGARERNRENIHSVNPVK